MGTLAARNVEVVLPLPAPIAPLSRVRSTLLLAGVESLREEGLFDDYLGHLPPHVKSLILEAVVGEWIPVEAALEHYSACDRLGLPPTKQAALGGRTFTRIKGTLLGTAVRMATGAGVTPWSALGHVDRFWGRGYLGSAIGVTKTGPKDAEAHMVGTPLVTSPYFRNAFRGLTSGLLELFCVRCIVTERPEGSSGSSRVFRVQWA